MFYLTGVSCGYDEFRCKNGQCIPLEWKCDGMVDCGINDTSDEDNCDNKGILPQHTCSHGNIRKSGSKLSIITMFAL